MAIKTQQTEEDVLKFLNGIEDETKKSDCLAILKMMEEVCGEKPKMWGTAIIGFGSYHYKSQSGQEGEWFYVGFSPRKQYNSVYTMVDLEMKEEMLSKLGKFKHGRSCLNIKKNSDIDFEVLTELVRKSVKAMKKRYS